MPDKTKRERSGYDKYINYRTFSIAVGAFVLILLLPMPSSMLDVGVEYSVSSRAMREFFSEELFDKPYAEVEQWQAATAEAFEAVALRGATKRTAITSRNQKALAKLGVKVLPEHLTKMLQFVEQMKEETFSKLMSEGRALRYDLLTYDDLGPKQQKAARRAARAIKICIAMVAFVVVCFVTEAMPLPGVAFCIGLILVFGGIVSRRDVASLFWSDACWFIMGSLMFAAAFVKTGVDKRICLLLFKRLAKPRVGVVVGILILVIAPGASFISDHALAAMFLPIAIVLYQNSLGGRIPTDPELGKMLMITICMACNIGGFGSPSGGARNVIMMTYLEDMFGVKMGYGEWILYGMPFVLIMMPILWLLLRWRFKPKVRDLGPALEILKKDITRMGGWNRKQVIAVVIFAVMLFGWITEKSLIRSLLGFEVGIGVIAVAGAVAYLLTGVVNWRDYQEKVDWGVVWLYAGAIIFGKVLADTGAAYWMARSVVHGLAAVGLAGSGTLVAMGSAVTATMTNLMADGPAAAAVGPVTLNMAAVTAPGSTLVPFMALATACSSSFAYLLIIGTPPNAIVYASGYLTPKDYLRVGIPCFAIAFVVLMLLSQFYWPLLGFQGLPAS